VRCSSFELQLDAYVEGTLSAAGRARIDAHLATCSGCAALLAEYRVVDALLLTPLLLEPAPNFTFKVMADVRSLPAPREGRTSILALLGTYIAFGWITIGAFLLWGGSLARAMLATLGESMAHAASVAQSLASVTGHSFGPRRFDVTAAMGGLLGADVLVAAVVVALYAFRRSRRASEVRATGPC